MEAEGDQLSLPPVRDIFETCLGCVGVVSTDFGFHVIVVDSLRSSKYKDMKKEEYNDFAFKFATGYIEEPLKDLASSHDSLLLNQNGVRFNNLVVAGFIDSVKVATLSSKNKSRSSVDFVGILNSYPGVFFEYNKDFYGGAWIGQKFLSPFYKRKRPNAYKQCFSFVLRLIQLQRL